MTLKKERGSNKARGLCRLAIDEDMTIYAIKALKQGISKELDTYRRFELNLSGVEEIDSAGIQLLLALESELTKKEKEFKLTAVSGAVAKLIENYGISDRFNLGDAA